MRFSIPVLGRYSLIDNGGEPMPIDEITVEVLLQRVIGLEHRVQTLESDIDSIKRDVSHQLEKLKDQIYDLNTTAAETKVYITQIFSILDKIEKFIDGLHEAHERRRESRSHRWSDFGKQALISVLSGGIMFLVYLLVSHITHTRVGG